MNYKDLIKSRKIRIKIMQFLSFVPDELMVKIQYKIKTGRKLNLKEPQRFTEKLQWYKLHYRDPLMAQCVDKYDVRKYVKDCGLEYILNEIYGIYEDPDDVDFNILPKQFVIKDTLGGGGNSVIIVRDKLSMDVNKVKKQMKEWVEEPTNKKHPGREWVYEGRKHRIIIEKYIESDEADGGLIDYKFFCAYGETKNIYVIADRDMGNGAGVAIYDENFLKLDVLRVDERPLEREIIKPDNFEELLNISRKLACVFPEARVDLYNHNGEVIFGEITFFDGSGYMTFEPDEFDFVMGSKFKIVNKEET